MTLHAHFETYSTDCDGAISRDWVRVQTEEQAAAEFGDIHFHDSVVADVVNTYSLLASGSLRVERLGDAHDAPVRLSWSEATEEGGRQVEATICQDDCDLGEHHYRDHAAEAMGY